MAAGMATEVSATAAAAAAAVAPIRQPVLVREATDWLQRAHPSDLDRFERVFQTLRATGEAPPAETAADGFVKAMMSKVARLGSGKPPVPRSGGQGWSYTATKASQRQQANSTALQPSGAYSTSSTHADSLGHASGAGRGLSARPGRRVGSASQQDFSKSANGVDSGAIVSEGGDAGVNVYGRPRPSSAPNNRELHSFLDAAKRRAAAADSRHGCTPPLNLATASGLATMAAAHPPVSKAFVRQQTQHMQQAALAAAAAAAGPTSGGGQTSAAESMPSAASLLPAAGPHASSAPALTCADTTTYSTSYSLRELYPELYEAAVAGTKADAVPNYTLISEYADSLKKGNMDAWKANLRTMYTSANEEMAKVVTDSELVKAEAFFSWMAKQQTYYRDLLPAAKVADMEQMLRDGTPAQKQEILDVLRQVHANLKPDQLKSHSQAVHCKMARTEDPELTALIREQTRLKTMGGPPPQFSSTSATAHQSSTSTQSSTHLASSGDAATYAHGAASGGSGDGNPSYPNGNPSYPIGVTWGANSTFPASGRQTPQARPSTASAINRTLDLRFPGAAPEAAEHKLGSLGHQGCASAGDGRPMTGQRQQQRPASAAAAFGQTGREQSLLPGGLSLRKETVKKPKKETFHSTVPLKWAIGNHGPATSSYIDHFGGLKVGGGGGGGPRLDSADMSRRAVRYKEFTAPIGAVNPVTALTGIREYYPVPLGMTGRLAFPQPPGDATMSTTTRVDYAPRDAGDVVRTLKAAANLTEASKKATFRSTIPLGKGGLNLHEPKQWSTEMASEYHPHVLDVRGDYERAQALLKLFNGPTASVGKVAYLAT